MRAFMGGAWCGGWILAALLAASTTLRAELPPLVPRAVLFGDPQKDVPQISPGGERLAYVAPSAEGVVNVWVRTLGQQDARQVTRDERAGIGLYAWAWDGRHLLYLQDRDGDENLHLWSVDVESGLVRDLTPFQGARAQNLLTSPARRREVLVGLNVRDPRVFDMYRIDLETGACVLDTENPGDVLAWTTDRDFAIRAACVLDGTDGSTKIRVRDAASAPWRDLLATPFAETPMPGQANGGTVVLGFTPDGRALHLVTYRGADTTRLVKVDAATGVELETLAHDPKADFWMVFGADATLRYRVLLHPTTHAVQAVPFESARVEWRALDASVTPDLEVLRRAAGKGCFDIQNRTADDRIWVVAMWRAEGPTTYSLYHRDTRRLEPLFEDRPGLAAQPLVPVEPIRLRARDGLDLHGYLALPAGVPPRKLPLVLLVHGGPWFRDGWFYDPTVQWLANRGYAVLQLEFRGSAGYGKRHLNAGNGQWGGAMQDDLTDAVRWAVGRGLADPRRVGIVGGSYGGYATLAGLAFTPDLYACGVDIVGPSNVATVLAAIPPYWRPVKKRWILRVGDVENDAELNRRISPLFHAGAIRAPLLIGHGANDPRVKLAESEQIVAALRERGMPVTFVVYPDEGHGFARKQNNLDFSGRMEEFLARHLGGRSEPWQAVDGASAEVR